jgi:pimeloyl-ACP methyl ester carboxylesterase
MTPVLLIHGLFGSLSAPRILSAFGDRQVLAPDLIGYGAHRDAVPHGWTLQDQADHVAAYVRDHVDAPVHVVGHSVGGAVAVFLARRHPDLVRSLTSVEGNLTLGDAFWSRKISTRTLPEIDEEVAGFRDDVAAWIGRSGVAATPFALATAGLWLDNQPASTLRTQARAVIAATGERGYLELVRAILASGVPVHLVAGARTGAGWNVPEWLSAEAASSTIIPNAGHLMMLEDPEIFAETLLRNLNGRSPDKVKLTRTEHGYKWHDRRRL